MQFLKLLNGQIFEVDGVVEVHVMHKSDGLEITFSASTILADVLSVYDDYMNPNFSSDNLARFELFDENMVLQGVQNGYVLVENVLVKSGVIKVRLAKEEAISTEVRELKQINTELKTRMSATEDAVLALMDFTMM